MGRRTRVVTVTADGRDKGKSFLLTEMPADQGEWWATRALIVMGNAGVDLPANALGSAMAGLAAAEASKGTASALFLVGLRMLPGVAPQALKPLLDEMMTCVAYQPPGQGLPAQSLMVGPYCEIEEISTRLQLRAEILELHLGFSLAGVASILGTTPPAVPASSATPTSPE